MDILLNRILGNILIINKIVIDYIIESIIYYRIIYNNALSFYIILYSSKTKRRVFYYLALL